MTSAALASAVDAAAVVSPGSTQGNYWGSAALALGDRQVHEGTNVVLHSEAVFSGSTTASALTAGVYVSFLSLDFDPAGFDQLTFRVSNGTTSVLEQVFADPGSAAAFFTQDLLLAGLTSTSTRFPGQFELHFGLDFTSHATGSRFGTVFAIGTGYVPEPDTGTLVLLGLVVLIACRRVVKTA